MLSRRQLQGFVGLRLSGTTQRDFLPHPEAPLRLTPMLGMLPEKGL